MAEIIGTINQNDYDTDIGMVGLGLIGGSMVRAAKKHTIHRVLGYDINEQAMQAALDSGSIDDRLTDENIPNCRIIMIAIIPDQLIQWVETHAPLFTANTILVDCCGVKRYIYDRISPLAKKYGFQYVGGHPMAGREVAGFENSSAELYRDASMILCPDETTTQDTLSTLEGFYLSLGFGDICYSTPEQHDGIISYTSQLAHVTSSAYIKSPTSRRRMGFTAGSYKDMTRVARLDPDMWTQLFLDNADMLEGELEELVGNLTDYLNAIKTRDPEELRRLLQEGRDLKITEPIENC